jgi:D-inositol-3-phosphate glycosyltransferase
MMRLDQSSALSRRSIAADPARTARSVTPAVPHERLRIGVVTHNYPPHLGGLEAIVHQLVRGFARHHDVTVVTTAWEDRRGVSTEDGATVHRLPASHLAETMGVPYALPFGPGASQAWKALRSCDVLHAHGSLYATTLLAAMARRPTVPLFITEHVGVVPYESALLNQAQRLAWASIGAPAVRRSAAVIAYNTRVSEWLVSRFGAEAVAFIPNGVETTTFRPRSADERRRARQQLGLPEGEVLALFVGRDSQKKNLDAVLRFRSDAYRLVVCGAHRTLSSAVCNLGAVPYASMPDVFAACDFLIHAATGEGFPLAVQEAMASGLPVALLWDHGYDGSVPRDEVVAVDSLDALDRAAADLASAPERRRALGQRARDYAERQWNWDTTVERYLDLFQTRAATCHR